MKIKFFILIVLTFCLVSCADVFTRNIGKDITPGDQMLAGNYSTILDKYPELIAQSS